MNPDKSRELYGGILTFNDEEHHYTFNGTPAPGVTSILKETLGTSAAIGQWMANTASEFIRDALTAAWVGGNLTPDDISNVCKAGKTAHRKVSKEATDIGKEVHQFAEHYLKTREEGRGVALLPENEKAAKGATAFLEWVDMAHLKPIGVERMIFSKRWWYSGTCDYYGYVNGKLSVLDLKTSSGVYREMPLQLAAYAVALEEELGDPIDDGWIIRLCKKTGACEPYHIPITDGLRQAWLRVKELHESLKKVDALTEELRNGLRQQAA